MDKPLSFRPLGKQLKALRDRARETLAEASGAVEIESRELASFEIGHSRPTEEVLLLLISHFGVRDDEALKLWELAGYSMDKIPISHMASDRLDISQSVAVKDSRILFTDIVDVVVNNYGVVMNFSQNTGPHTPPAAVARVGMSREHAKSILHILQVTLAQTERNLPKIPKKLIAPDNPAAEDPARN